MFGRPLSQQDKEDITSWKLHVEDDFFVVNHRPREGAVFVQCGRMQTRDKCLGGSMNEKDYHEPRVFVVQGLSDPLASLVKPLVERFKEENRSIKEDLPDVDICLLHTALLPYSGGITYMTVISPGKTSHYASMLDMKNASNVAVDAAKRAFDVDDNSGVPFYRHFCLNKDVHIRRLASDPLNFGHSNPNLAQDPNTMIRKAPNDTCIRVAQMFWTPIADKNDPRYDTWMQRVVA